MTDASNELILRYGGACVSREVRISMDQLLVVLITALVTAAFSFTGLWIGARLTRRNEARKWRRDRVLEHVPRWSNHSSTVMPALVAGIHVFFAELQRARRGWPGHKGVHARLRRAA